MHNYYILCPHKINIIPLKEDFNISQWEDKKTIILLNLEVFRLTDDTTLYNIFSYYDKAHIRIYEMQIKHQTIHIN